MLFRLSDVYKSYAAQDVLRGVSIQVNPGEHIGLVGRNGAGKTTVFRLISGGETPDKGEVVRTRGLRLGLLEQHVHFDEEMSVHQAALSAFTHLQAMEREMRDLEHQMSEAGDLEQVLERYSDLQHRYEREGGFEYAAKAEAILQGLGFTSDTWMLPTNELSGGQKNRLGMARLLLASPDILLLDEPTNHLDVAAVEWLEEFLSTYPQAYIVISHDRYFLDRVCNRIIEMEAGRAASYTGNYSAFLVEREARREAQQRAYDNQQQLIAKTEEFIRRNLAGQKTKQAKSRRTMLEKLERVEAVRVDQSSGDFRLKAIERAGTQVLVIKEAAVGYTAHRVLASDMTFTLRRGEALGIIGPNGSGKTTLVRTLLGKLTPLGGEIQWGANVRTGYYAQQLDDLDDRNEIIMELRRVAASTATAGELRGFLAKFLFTGDDVYKHVSDLSGGEKGRLALAKLIYSRVNVLVLDEPTNHLDIPSREALEEALDAYEGTIITISHDRYFLDRVATQILALDGTGGAEHYDGDYTGFHEWQVAERQSRAAAARTEAAKNVQVTQSPPSSTAKDARSASSPSSTKSAGGKGKRQNDKQREPQIIEAEIAEAERQLAALSQQLSDPVVARDLKRLSTCTEQYKKADEHLQSLYSEWEQTVKETTNA